MNIVDLVSSQLSPEVIGSLGRIIGADDKQTRAATGAAVPALLEVFGKMASSPTGADALSKAMGGLDLSTLGNLVGTLAGGQSGSFGSKGGDLLGSLLGGGNLTSIVGLLAKFVGSNPAMLKTLLGYLGPVVLGVVAKQLAGRTDARGVAQLFADQASNISGALPKGLQLGDVMSALSSGVPGARQAATAAAQAGGLPGWLVPALVLAALAVGYFLFNKPKNEKPVPVGGGERAAAVDRAADQVQEAVEQAVETATEVSPAITELTGIFTTLTETLGGVTDAASAEAVLPKLKELAPALDGVQQAAAALPEAGKKSIVALIADKLGGLKTLVETAMALPGVKEILEPVVVPMIEALEKLGS